MNEADDGGALADRGRAALGRARAHIADREHAGHARFAGAGRHRHVVAFERALPQMPREELVWRMHFMFGTLSYTLAATDTVQLIAGCKPEDRYDAALLEERLTSFLSAGLDAPLKTSIKKAA